LAHAGGSYVQFLDGDMIMAHDWPEAALAYLEEHPDIAVVCGTLEEARQGALHKALEIDWGPRAGPVRHCGGAAMFRKDALTCLGGFPEELDYGEEPYLCWRIRNELRCGVYQLPRTMAVHDLGLQGFGDYWRRHLRVGATYAEIAAQCARSTEKLWLREAISHLLWAGALVAVVLALIFAPLWLKAAIGAVAAAVLLRKTAQISRHGCSAGLSLVYAVHTYFAKLPLALGELGWLGRGLVRRAAGRPKEDEGP